MHTISQDNKTSLEDECDRWENEGGSLEPSASLTPEKVDQVLDAEQEPFPSVMAGELDLKELKLVRLIDEGCPPKPDKDNPRLVRHSPAFAYCIQPCSFGWQAGI
jgi:hypothetical protein